MIWQPQRFQKGFENKVRLNFSNDPQTNSKGQTPWDSVVCYTYQVRGLKTNEKDVKLEGLHLSCIVIRI